MAHIAKGSLLVRVGAALSSLVLLGVSGLAYLFVTDAYDTYPYLGYRAVFTVLGVLIPLPLASSSVSSRCASTRCRYSS